MMGRYWWSEDETCDLCEKAEYVLPQETDCYHCDAKMPKGATVAKLTCVDGDIYLMHEDCFKKSSIILSDF